jgi:hypothetical protein
LLEQEQMWALNVEEMESSSKIDLKDVSWWMSIKDAYKPKVLIIVKFSKERCIFLVARGKLSQTTWKRCGPPLNLKDILFKLSLLKIWNLKHKYKTTKAQLPKKIDGA